MEDVELVATGYGTVEGPTLASDGNLYFGDVRHGGVYRLLPDDSVELVLAKRRGVGGICAHADGGVVVSGRDVSHIVEGRSRVIYAREQVPVSSGLSAGGFNDIGADPDGRIWAGVQRMTADGDYGPGALVLISAHGHAAVVYEGLLPNGNAVSLDEQFLFQIDSRAKRVLVFDLTHPLDGVVREFSTAQLPGSPDGCAVDEHGDLWIAFHHGGCVASFSPEGAVLRRIDFTTPTVTSVCFGPAGSGTLYVVSDDETNVGPDAATPPNGSIYRVDVGVSGAEVHPARV
jgi:gluconolactonase